MSSTGLLSALTLTAGAGMIPSGKSQPGIGAALDVNASLTSNINDFTLLPITSQFSNVVTLSTGILSGNTLTSLRTLGASTFPALTNAIPSSVTPVLGSVANGGFTGLIGNTASGMLGGGDTGVFAQILNSVNVYALISNQYLNSALNADALSSTFGPVNGGMNNLITGGFGQTTTALGVFANDLEKTGSLINLKNLSNLGDPSALVQQLALVGGITSEIESILRSIGVTTDTLINSSVAGLGLSPTANKLLYKGLEKIEGTALAQVLRVLGVTTPGINTAADLLNPLKILPNSFPSLTTPTPNGLRATYATTTGAINTNLEKLFIDPNAPAYAGDDPIVRARLGLVTLDSQQNTTAI
jgi:hypothetical protein